MVLVTTLKPTKRGPTMKKSSTIKQLRVKPEETRAALSVQLQEIDLNQVVKVGLEELMFQTGMLLVQQVMEAEAKTLAGARYERGPDKNHYRWGSQNGAIYVQGQKKTVSRPRLMKKEKVNGKLKEVELETYKAFSKPDSMNESMLVKLLAGVSMRDYAATVEQAVEGHGISKSAVSRRATKVTAQAMEEFYNRRLDDREFVVIMIDGISIKNSENIVALGIDVWGKKVPLGVRQGATENHTVCTELIEELIERGLSPDGDYLFVIDGSKALSKAIRKVFGTDVVIQRCQIHKRRNIKDKLPKEHQTRIDKKLSAAYGMNDVTEARRALEKVFDELVKLSEPAAGSLMEGMEETLTVHKLRLGSDLKRMLSTTNSIESMFSMARRYKRNVKRWKNYKHIERTLVTTLLEAEKRFRRVRGYRELKDLKNKIRDYRDTTKDTIAA